VDKVFKNDKLTCNKAGSMEENILMETTQQQIVSKISEHEARKNEVESKITVILLELEGSRLKTGFRIVDKVKLIWEIKLNSFFIEINNNEIEFKKENPEWDNDGQPVPTIDRSIKDIIEELILEKLKLAIEG
jgi:hypothetical protein